MFPFGPAVVSAYSDVIESGKSLLHLLQPPFARLLGPEYLEIMEPDKGSHHRISSTPSVAFQGIPPVLAPKVESTGIYGGRSMTGGLAR